MREIEEVRLRAADHEFRVRVYPADEPSGAALVWLHGGAFMFGTIDMPEADQVARDLAARGIPVVSVGYTLAPLDALPDLDAVEGDDGLPSPEVMRAEIAAAGPRARFPVASLQTVAAFDWAVAHAAELGCDPARIGLGGASAGGNLAAGAAIRLRDRGTAVATALLLAYPVLHAELPAAGAELEALLADVPGRLAFPPEEVRAFNINYVGDPALLDDPAAFPAGHDQRGLPPTVIVVAERDRLRSSAQAFAAEVALAGGEVAIGVERDALHGFLNEAGHPAALRTAARFAAALAPLRITMTDPFPDGFLWGVATAGHQNEGGNDTSDTWFLEHVTPTVFREPSGVACDGWNRWQEDLDLVAGMGLNAYRFSVEWARAEPEEGRLDPAALDHYETVIDGCLARGLAPIVTFNHFTAPHWFAKRGGMLGDGADERFARYCDAVTARFGDRIALAMTLNEPNLPRLLDWVLPEFVLDLTRKTLGAASEAAGVERYRAGNAVQPEDYDAMEDGYERAHRAGRAAIKARRSDLPVGFSIALVDDAAVAGGEGIRDRKRAEVYGRWLALAKDDDFVGVQNYERVTYGPDGALPAPDGVPLNEMGSPVEPASLEGSVRYAYEATGVPVLVSEHGIGTDDDALRVGFLEPSLAGLKAAMDDGVPVLGYCHWTLLDNFEWIGGYSSHLGLVAVDRGTLDRTPKPSAAEYARLVRALSPA